MFVLTDVHNLQKAINDSQFDLHYQPQIELSSGKMCGVEALLRWNHPQKGLISPMEFIPQVEKTGLIGPLGEWIIGTACQQAKSWQEQGCRLEKIAVNISIHQFEKSDLVQVIKDTLQRTSLSPTCLELEITESAVAQNVCSTQNSLRELQSLGVSIALDDFGTGYSSLSHLRQLPIDTIKIDRSFIKEIRPNSRETTIVSSIIDLAHKLNLKVVAEGVETEEQMDILVEESCDEIQGYLISRPLPKQELEKLFQDQEVL